MEIKSFIIENSDADLFDTELKFYIASARASGSELICLNYEGDDVTYEKIKALINKSLKAQKKQGRIDFFATEIDFSENSACASYLLNRFPEVEALRKISTFLAFIKL